MPRDLRLATAFDSPELVVVPVGSVEQHCGLPAGLDCLIAERLAWEACSIVEERGGVECWVAPPLCYGFSPEWSGSPGTVTLPLSVFAGVVESVARGLAEWGARVVVFLNGHGGNSGALAAALHEAAAGLGRRLVLAAIDYWRAAGVDLGHASEAEAELARQLGAPVGRPRGGGCGRARVSGGPALVVTPPTGRPEEAPAPATRVDARAVAEAVAEAILDAASRSPGEHWIA